MTRNERRKAVRTRKDAKAKKLNSRALSLIQSETLKRNLARPMPKHSGKGMGNRGIYVGFGLYPLPGYGEGGQRMEGLSDRELTKLQHRFGKPKA